MLCRNLATQNAPQSDGIKDFHHHHHKGQEEKLLCGCGSEQFLCHHLIALQIYYKQATSFQTIYLFLTISSPSLSYV